MKHGIMDYEIIGEGIPVLIIAGKNDSEVGYKDQFDLMRIYPKATYCAVDNAGHNLQIEQPEIFVSLVSSWLLQKADK